MSIAAGSRSARRSATLPLAGLGIVLGAAALSVGLASGGDAAERWLFATRYTARISFPLFLLAWTASSLARLAPSDSPRALLRGRRGLGLGFAAAHTIHLAALSTYFNVSGARPNLVTVLGGGLTYLFIFAMAATSNDAAQKRLGRNWTRLHTVGGYLIWLIFAQSYAGRVASGKTFFVPQLILVIGALALRIAAASRKRERNERAQ
jgi:DMSO/TMAO reductase YedYZ heme-binding membrane subunit